MEIIKNRNLEFYNRPDSRNIVFNRKTKKSYTLGDDEFRILEMLDKDTSSQAILDRFPQYSLKDLKNLIDIYDAHALLERDREQPFRLKDITKIKLPLLNLERQQIKEGGFASTLYKMLVHLSIPVFVLGVVLFVALGVEGTVQPKNLIGLKTAIVFILSSLISLSVHELAHGLAGKMNNAVVPELGLMLYMFVPCAYTTVCGMSSIKDKKGKVIVICAGILANLFLAGICLILLVIFGKSTETVTLLALALLSNFIPIIANGIIFLKWDGYYLVTTLLEEPQLYEKSTAYVGNLFKGRKQERNSLLGAYGIAAVFYTAITIISFGYSLVGLLFQQKIMMW